jgi:hypothetical protein
MAPPLLCSGLIEHMVAVGADADYQPFLADKRLVVAVVFFVRIELGWQVALQEGHSHLREGNAFCRVSHRVGRYVVRPSCFGAQLFAVERAILGSQELNKDVFVFWDLNRVVG